MAEEKKSKKKYLLFKKDEGDAGAKPCAFFQSDQGCRNGSNCPFLHVKANSAPVQQEPPKVQRTSSNNSYQPPVQQQQQQQQSYYQPNYAPPAPVQQVHETPKSKEKKEKKEKKERRKSRARDEDSDEEVEVKDTASKRRKSEEGYQKVEAQPANTNSFASQLLGTLGVPVTPFTPPGFGKQRDEEDDSNFLFAAVNTVLQGGLPSTPMTPMSVQKPENNMFLKPQDIPKVLETSGTTHATQGSKNKSVKKPEKSQTAQQFQWSMPQQAQPVQKPAHTPQTTSFQQQSMAPPQTYAAYQQQQAQFSFPPAFTPMQAPPTLLDPRVANWQTVVNDTKAHSRFPKEYTFAVDNTWVQPKPFGDWCKNVPPIIAIDCEMCQTTDPVTGVVDQQALVRFSVVNGLNPEEIIIDTLVNPGLPVTDMRTHIHGITEDQTRGVHFTLRHAQALLYNLVSDRSIIVGHALFNDLRCLKFNHTCVVDTAYLFNIVNEPSAAPSMRDIAEFVIGTKLPNIHDSVLDARAAMQAAVYRFHNGVSPPIPRSAGDATTLMIHRIPDNCTEQHIYQMIMTHTNVVPSKIQPISRSPNRTEAAGKTTAMFTSVKHAELAFESLPGPERPDKSNKPQKRVYIKGGGYICIRKS